MRSVIQRVAGRVVIRVREPEIDVLASMRNESEVDFLRIALEQLTSEAATPEIVLDLLQLQTHNGWTIEDVNTVADRVFIVARKKQLMVVGANQTWRRHLSIRFNSFVDFVDSVEQVFEAAS